MNTQKKLLYKISNPMKRSSLVRIFLIISVGMVAQTPRLSLVEEFTGETCLPCAFTNPGLKRYFNSERFSGNRY